jgi:hypothetical protein
MLTVQCEVPCGSLVHSWLHVHEMPFRPFVERSRQFERAYLAWETVRKVRNPFFTEGTGFEGYYVGLCHSTEEMLDMLLHMGRQMLASNVRLYPHQHRFRSRLMKTLSGEVEDLDAIAVWADLLGATLGRLRCNVYTNQETYRFQNETYWSVNRLPLMQYEQSDCRLEQSYRLAQFRVCTNSRLPLQLNLLNSSDYDAGLVVSAIGRFGHPLIREYLHEGSSPK